MNTSTPGAADPRVEGRPSRVSHPCIAGWQAMAGTGVGDLIMPRVIVAEDGRCGPSSRLLHRRQAAVPYGVKATLTRARAADIDRCGQNGRGM